MIDKLLLKHVGQPHILDLGVHQVSFFSWVSQGGHSEQLLFFALFYQSTPSCLKVIGWGGVGGPCDYCVSPVQRIGFLGFLDLVRIWGLLGQGIGDLDSGLTIRNLMHNMSPFIVHRQSKVSRMPHLNWI